MLTEKIRETATWLFVRDRKRAYQVAFRSPSGAIVLNDLAKFCRATSPTWGSTPEETARYVGRNEVWHRIMQHLNLTEDELFATYGGKFPITQVDDG
ncbi:MAG: hypothetical protein AB7H90_03275 [Alphaproteobacteria bacterium]